MYKQLVLYTLASSYYTLLWAKLNMGEGAALAIFKIMLYDLGTAGK